MKLFKKGKKPKGGGYLLVAAMIGLATLCVKAEAATDPIRFEFGGGHALLLPLQNVNGTEVYSFREGKGFPAIESVLYTTPSRKFQVTAGAAAELGTSHAVPFAGAQFRLPQRFFDTSNNDLYFGFAVAKHPDAAKSWRGVEVMLKASTALW
jgi:hypothetical protein